MSLIREVWSELDKVRAENVELLREQVAATKRERELRNAVRSISRDWEDTLKLCAAAQKSRAGFARSAQEWREKASSLERSLGQSLESVELLLATLRTFGLDVSSAVARVNAAQSALGK